MKRCTYKRHVRAGAWLLLAALAPGAYGADEIRRAEPASGVPASLFGVEVGGPFRAGAVARVLTRGSRWVAFAPREHEGTRFARYDARLAGDGDVVAVTGGRHFGGLATCYESLTRLQARFTRRFGPPQQVETDDDSGNRFVLWEGEGRVLGIACQIRGWTRVELTATLADVGLWARRDAGEAE